MVFLDLEIEKVLQAAHHIRNDLNDEETAIVIMSPSENCSSEIIKVHPLDYLVYPLDYEKTRGLGILISLYSGLRIGEVCALKWKNISVKEGILKDKR